MADFTLTEENHVSSILLFPTVVIHHKLKLFLHIVLKIKKIATMKC